MEAIERLVSIEAIKLLKAQYFRAVDTKAWGDLERLFTSDATLEFPEARPEPFSRNEFMGLMRSAYSRCVTIHHGHTPEIEIEGPDHASGIWAMADERYFAPDNEHAPAAVLIGAGHYHERYVRRGGHWLIHALRLTRFRLVSQSQPRAIS